MSVSTDLKEAEDDSEAAHLRPIDIGNSKKGGGVGPCPNPMDHFNLGLLNLSSFCKIFFFLCVNYILYTCK